MPLVRPRTGLLLCALAGGLLGCGSTTEALGPCTSPVTVSIGAGRTPQISWAPACAVAQLIVFSPPSLGGPSNWWAIKSSTMDIRPPVQFGSTPAGAQEVIAAQPLDLQRSIFVIVSDVQGNGLGDATRNP
jgi:hypothetical protein